MCRRLKMRQSLRNPSGSWHSSGELWHEHTGHAQHTNTAQQQITPLGCHRVLQPCMSPAVFCALRTPLSVAQQIQQRVSTFGWHMAQGQGTPCPCLQHGAPQHRGVRYLRPNSMAECRAGQLVYGQCTVCKQCHRQLHALSCAPCVCLLGQQHPNLQRCCMAVSVDLNQASTLHHSRALHHAACCNQS